MASTYTNLNLRLAPYPRYILTNKHHHEANIITLAPPLSPIYLSASSPNQRTRPLRLPPKLLHLPLKTQHTSHKAHRAPFPHPPTHNPLPNPLRDLRQHSTHTRFPHASNQSPDLQPTPLLRIPTLPSQAGLAIRNHNSNIRAPIKTYL